MIKIPLTQGQYALIDNEDYGLINKYKWHAAWCGKAKTYYAKCYIKVNNKLKQERIHKIIMATKQNEIVDHIDHNGLNCQKYNLRKCTKAQNRWNSRKQSNTKCKYKGVYKKYKNKKFSGYQIQITHKGKKINLGFTKNEIYGAIIYNRAALKYFGKFAYLNEI